MDWITLVAEDIRKEFPLTEESLREIITRHHPEAPLLECVMCHNTESCAGALAREWNRGRCRFCAGYFKVVRA